MPKEISQRLRLLNPGNLDDWYGPYDSVASANAAVPAVIRPGKTVGVTTGGVISEYWWNGGVADGNLVSKGGGSFEVAQVFNEAPTGMINGANALFAAAFPFVPETLVVKVNGITMQPVAEFVNINTTQFQLTFSPMAGEIISINYVKA